MSTLKFKSKISVPGIYCTTSDGGKSVTVTPGQVIVNNGDENLNTTITPGKIELSYNEDDEIKTTLSYSGIDIKQIKTNQITQKDATQSITIGSSSSAPVVANYISTKQVTLPGLNISQAGSDLQLSNTDGTSVGTLLSDNNVSKLINASDIYYQTNTVTETFVN